MSRLAQFDRGPFKVGKSKDGWVHIYSDDFKHDVMLKINGDFGDEDRAQEYAEALAEVLNDAVVGEQNSISPI